MIDTVTDNPTPEVSPADRRAFELVRTTLFTLPGDTIPTDQRQLATLGVSLPSGEKVTLVTHSLYSADRCVGWLKVDRERLAHFSLYPDRYEISVHVPVADNGAQVTIDSGGHKVAAITPGSFNKDGRLDLGSTITVAEETELHGTAVAVLGALEQLGVVQIAT